jgi:HEPN domain-containing protein
VNRAELRQLAEDRILDAKSLLTMGRWSGAYYLAGYAVECGLKSCIIGYLMVTDQFPEKKFSEQCWTHDLNKLLKLADLETAFANDAAANATLSINWSFVTDWDEASRYQQKSQAEAQRLYDAIADNANGVLSWIRLHW